MKRMANGLVNAANFETRGFLLTTAETHHVTVLIPRFAQSLLSRGSGSSLAEFLSRAVLSERSVGSGDRWSQPMEPLLPEPPSLF